MHNSIVFANRAKERFDGLPIGNGRLAAVVSGSSSSDIISLNHERLWTGIHKSSDSKFKERISEIKDLLRKGDFTKASAYSNAYFGNVQNEYGVNTQSNFYFSAGILRMNIINSKLIKRELSFNDAIVSVHRKSKKAKVKSEILAHSTTGLIMGKWSADRVFSCALSFDGPDTIVYSNEVFIRGSTLLYDCSLKHGIRYRVIITVMTDGEILSLKNTLKICNAFEVEAYVNIITSYDIDKKPSPYTIPNQDWGKLLTAHKSRFSELYNRVSLAIPPCGFKVIPNILYSKKRMRESVFPLLFNYSRYLLISSTINCELPPNSQGKWYYSTYRNNKCDYSFNQYIHMFYWIAEGTNLPESVDLLADFLQAFRKEWNSAARELFDNRGLFVPEHTDSFGRATTQSIIIGAAGWLSRLLINHFEYNGDIDFLSDKAYPFIRDAALFYEDFLFEDNDGSLHIVPSRYPEEYGDITNRIGMSSTLDISLAYDTLDSAIRASEILNIDDEQRDTWRKIKNKLNPFIINSRGMLSEWLVGAEPFEPGCFRYSSMYGLYPSEILYEENRSSELEAAYKTLDYYVSQDTRALPENMVWAALMYAKGGYGKKAINVLNRTIKSAKLTKGLLFVNNNNININVNVAFGAAIVECIVAYRNGKVHLTESLPKDWGKRGSLKGIRVPGGHILDISWKNGLITEITVTMGYRGKIVFSELKAKLGLKDIMESESNDITIEKAPGEIVHIM